MLSYAAVVATRNRRDALALSLPLLLAQSRPPAEVLVVDASDAPAPVAALVEGLAATTDVPLRYLSSPAGSARQRNAGIAETASDVIVFPDDDSLLLPGAAAAIMAVYERDTEGRVGAVGGMESAVPPEGAVAGAAYAMTRADRARARVAGLRARLQDRLAPDPLALRARALAARLGPPPDWLAELDAVPVEWLTGFRMSFRREAIARAPFDETLGRYALMEDIDACLSVQHRQHVVVARGAGIHHHKAPGARTGGRTLGAMHLLNRAYVTARHGPVDAALRAAILRHARSKVLQYRAGAGGAYGRDRLAGARAALAVLPRLLDAPDGALERRYLELRRACLETSPA